jgi:single-strand DNA-binding protein
MNVEGLNVEGLNVEGLNVAVAVGRLARPAELRVLPSGDRVVSIELTVPREKSRAESVPVSWFEAPASATELGVDQQVLVVGRVRRRFFKSATGTQSRTEIVAITVVPTRQAKRTRAALERAVDQLEAVIP